MSVDLMTDIPEELKYVSKPCSRPVGSMAHAIFRFIRLCKNWSAVRKKEKLLYCTITMGKAQHTLLEAEPCC